MSPAGPAWPAPAGHCRRALALIAGTLLAASFPAAGLTPSAYLPGTLAGSEGPGTGGVAPAAGGRAQGEPPPAAPAAAADSRPVLDRIIVESARVHGVPAFELPASLDSVFLEGDPRRTGAPLPQVLSGLPGLLARDRQNHAQDTQLSIRGFGARSTFGVRGLRLYSDGIPATMPDGQGQLSHFSLTGAERIELLRGPFSALHGNSSGGVLQLFSADGQAGDPWRLHAGSGSHGARQLAGQLLGGDERGGYNLALSHFATDGYRDHSAARRNQANLKLHLQLAGDRRLDLVANLLDLPDARDPLGLDASQVREDPRQAVAAADQYNTRKTVEQGQVGAIYRHALAPGQELRLAGHAGQRQVEQYLAVPVGAQANPLSSGGVIDLDNGYHGLDLRWQWQGLLAGRAAEFTLGGTADSQRQHRQGFENFLGEQLGIRGRQRRDERNRVGNTDAFAQLWWQFSPRWSLLAGLRHSQVRFRSRDHYITESNPDDSGRTRYRHTAPVAGLVFAPGADARWYLSAGRGFETPTFNELSYRLDGGAGLALDLRPAVSDHLEAGLKWRYGQGASLHAALFRADTDDELAVARNVGGRSSYRNVASARRQGLELAWSQPLAPDWQLDLAWTWLDARFREGYLICQGAGCTDPVTPVPAGARIPGTAREQAHASLRWQGRPWQAALELAALGAVTVNDLGSGRAPGHVLANLELARQWQLPTGGLRGYLRVDNLADHAHIGSVIVNEGNGRFYEPGPGRRWSAGLQWQWQR